MAPAPSAQKIPVPRPHAADGQVPQAKESGGTGPSVLPAESETVMLAAPKTPLVPDLYHNGMEGSPTFCEERGRVVVLIKIKVNAAKNIAGLKYEIATLSSDHEMLATQLTTVKHDKGELSMRGRSRQIQCLPSRDTTPFWRSSTKNSSTPSLQ